MRYSVATKFNALGAIGIILTLIAAYIIEFKLQEPPCPLCLLQRIGFLGIAFGFLLNLKFGIHAQHYAIALISALFTATVAARQVLLHIIPGTEFGSPLFHLHLYTWSFIAAVGIIIFIALALFFNQPLRHAEIKHPKWMERTILCIFTAVLALSLLNALTSFAICGFGACL